MNTTNHKLASEVMGKTIKQGVMVDSGIHKNPQGILNFYDTFSISTMYLGIFKISLNLHKQFKIALICP